MLAGGKKEASREGHGRYDGIWNWRGHDGQRGRWSFYPPSAAAAARVPRWVMLKVYLELASEDKGT